MELKEEFSIKNDFDFGRLNDLIINKNNEDIIVISSIHLTNRHYFSIYSNNFFTVIGRSNKFDILIFPRRKSYKTGNLVPVDEENLGNKIFAVSIESFCASFKELIPVDNSNKELKRRHEILSPILLRKLLENNDNIADIIANNISNNTAKTPIINQTNSNDKNTIIKIGNDEIVCSAALIKSDFKIPINGSIIIIPGGFHPAAVIAAKSFLKKPLTLADCTLPIDLEAAEDTLSLLSRLFYKNFEKFSRDYFISLISEDNNNFDTLNSYNDVKLTRFQKILELSNKYCPILI